MSQTPRINGLTDNEVLASRRSHGSNVLTPAKRTPWWKEFLKKFKYNEMPEFVRRSWATVQKIKDEESNTSLLDFF